MLPNAAAAPMTPFLLGTRRIVEEVTSRAFAFDGGVIDVELERVGYANALLIEIVGTVTVATATLVPKGAGVYNSIGRLVVDPPGQADLISASGWGVKLAGAIAHRPFLADRNAIDMPAIAGLQGNAYFDANLKDVFPLTVGTNAVRLFYVVPLNRNARDPRGSIGLGHGGERTRLRVWPSAKADLVTTPANITATALQMVVSQVYFTAPPVGVAQPDTGWAVVIEEQKQAIAGTGVQRVSIDPEGVILGAYQTVILNDLPNLADVTNITLSLNRDKVVDSVPRDTYLYLANQERPLTPWPLGVIPFEMDAYQADPEYLGADGHPRGRGWLYSDGLDDLFTELTIAAGATLGTQARIETVVKRLVKL